MSSKLYRMMFTENAKALIEDRDSKYQLDTGVIKKLSLTILLTLFQ